MNDEFVALLIIHSRDGALSSEAIQTSTYSAAALFIFSIPPNDYLLTFSAS